MIIERRNQSRFRLLSLPNGKLFSGEEKKWENMTVIGNA